MVARLSTGSVLGSRCSFFFQENGRREQVRTQIRIQVYVRVQCVFSLFRPLEQCNSPLESPPCTKILLPFPPPGEGLSSLSLCSLSFSILKPQSLQRRVERVFARVFPSFF